MKKFRDYLMKLCVSLAIVMSLFVPMNINAQESDPFVVTPGIIETGKKYAMEMNKRNSKLRMSGEVWSYVSSKVLVGKDAITGDFGRFVAKGLTKTETMSYSLSVGFNYKGFSLGVGLSGSEESTYSGPSDSAKLADGRPATHRAFFTIVTGKLVSYTYRITDKYSGAYIRTTTINQFADVDSRVHTALVYSPSTSIYFNNAAENKTKYLSNYSTYISQFSKKDGTCDNYYNF